MTTLAEAYALALECRRAGRRREGRAICRAILDVAPENAGTWHLSALLAWEEGDRETALAHVRQALERAADNPFFHNTLGEILRAGGEPQDRAAAKESYQQALRLDPNCHEALHNLGLAFLEERSASEAEAVLTRAAILAPEDVETLTALGLCLLELGRLQEAEASFRRALDQDPKAADVWNNLGLAHQRQARRDPAAFAYRRALELRPNFAEASNNLGALLQDCGRTPEAIPHCRKALALRPDFAEAHFNLGVALRDLGEMTQAAACFERALELRPDYPEATFARVMAELPLLYDAPEEIAAARLRYAERLAALESRVEALERRGDSATLRALAVGVGAAQPFFLPYQAQDDRALQTQYGRVAQRLMAWSRLPQQASRFSQAPAVRGGRARVRVGFVGGHFRRHSVWKMPTQGWVEALDRDRFELFAYDTRPGEDAVAQSARALFDRYRAGPLSDAAWEAAIAADAPDVLIYPELGMDPMSARLATLRLAPKQCASWGHPVTSGLPTMDYYLSSALMEPPEADQYYTETLVRLPNLSLWLTPPAPENAEAEDAVAARAAGRDGLGAREGEPAYWCCQSLFKYLPRHDDIFPRIAQAVGPCRFLFLGYLAGTAVNDRFEARLTRAFAARGLNAADYCRFLPRLSEAGFAAAAGLCDVFLDSLEWSGCNSVFECLAQGLPVVTLPGRFMRGRHAMAILRRLGVEETIAANEDDYVALAARLGKDAAKREDVRKKVKDGLGRLYRDAECVTALSAFLRS